MRIAIFGMGSIGQRHAANLTVIGGHELKCYDPEKIGWQSVVSDARSIWDWQPDAALICTPPATHRALAIAALEHDCHVFCEKPLATTALDARDIVQCNTDKKVLVVGYQLRFSLTGIQRWIFDRDLIVAHSQDMSTWPSLYSKDVLQEFSHEIDTALYLNGPVTELMAFQRATSAWQIELTHLHARSSVNIVATTGAQFKRVVSIADDDGRSLPIWWFDKAFNDESYTHELRAFLNACQGGGWHDQLCSGQEGAHVCRIIDACRESVRTCSVVKF